MEYAHWLIIIVFGWIPIWIIHKKEKRGEDTFWTIFGALVAVSVFGALFIYFYQQ
jgi:hypothetical protein